MTIYDSINAITTRINNAKQEATVASSYLGGLKTQADALNAQIIDLNSQLAACQAERDAANAALTVSNAALAVSEENFQRADTFIDYLGTDWMKETYRGATIDLTGYTETFRSDFDDLSQLTNGGGAGPWYAHVNVFNNSADMHSLGWVPSPYISDGAGNLILRVEKYNNRWQGGILQTMDSNGVGFSQGTEPGQGSYFEARMALPAAATGDLGMPGSWPSFWLLSASDYHPEINDHKIEFDVMETYGGDKGIHTTFHLKPRRNPLPGDYSFPSGRISKLLYSDPATVRYTGTSTPVYPVGTHIHDGQFHTFGLMIDDDGATAFFDGKAIGRFPMFDYLRTPFYMLIDHGLNTTSGAISPTDVKFDYVRALKKL